MSKVLKAYFPRTVRDFKAASGIVYTIQALTRGQYLGAIKGIPSLRKSTNPEGMPLDEAVAMQAAICKAAVLAMSFEGNREEGGDVPDPLDWPTGDVAEVFLEVQTAAKIVGAEADEARGLV